MNKNVCTIMLFLLSGIFLSGCIENALPDIVYVDKSFTSSVSGWGFDHFNSIQKAIDHCDEHGIIYVQNGTYQEDIGIRKTLSLIGADANDTILIGKSIDEEIVCIDSMGNVTFTGFTIRDSGIADSINPLKVGIRLQSSGNTIVGNIFINNSFGLYLEHSTENSIFNNFFSENEYGIYMNTYSDANNITQNAFVFNHVGVRLKGSTFNRFSYNIFSDNDGGIYLCCVSNDNCFFSNIFMRNSEWHAEDWCNNTWNSSENGNFWDDFYLINQGAIDNDSNGIIDSSYKISRGYNPKEYPNKDYLPLVYKPMIYNSFFKLDEKPDEKLKFL